MHSSRPRSPLLVLAALGLIALTPTLAHAQTIAFTNIPWFPGPPLYSNDSTLISSTSAPGIAFRVSTSGNLFDISVGLKYVSGPSHAITFYLREASPMPSYPTTAPLTGTLLETWNVSGLTAGGGLHTLTSTSHTYLDSTKFYFLYTKGTSGSEAAWFKNSIGDFGPILGSGDGTNFFKVDTSRYSAMVRTAPYSVTPEAPAVVQFLPALLPLALVLRRRQRAHTA